MSIPDDILRLEREAIQIHLRVAALERRDAAAEQAAAALWYNPWWEVSAAAPPAWPTTGIQVTAHGEAAPYAGATMTLLDSTGVTTLATATTDASGIAVITPPASGTYVVTVAAAGKTTFHLAGIAWSSGLIGYHALIYNTGTTMTFSDTHTTATTAWDVASYAWRASSTENTAYGANCAATGCSAATGVPVKFALFNDGSQLPGVTWATLFNCPQGGGSSFGGTVSLVRNSIAYYPLNVICHPIGSSSLYCSATPAITLTQP